jgi:hypothetical protein
MADQDFNDSFDKGKRAVNKAAGWVAGAGAATLGPIAKAAQSAVAKEIPPSLEAVKQDEAERFFAYQQRTLDLRRAVENTRQRPLHIAHVGWTLLLAVVLVSLAWQSTTSGRGVGVFCAVVIAISIGWLITLAARNQDVHLARRDLRRHLSNGKDVIYLGIFLIALIAAVCLITSINSQ